MPRRQKITTDEAALIRSCLATPADYAPWACLTDYYGERGPVGAAEVLAALLPGIRELPTLPHVWRTFVGALTGRPSFETLLAATADAMACATRVAAARPAPQRCGCGNAARFEWQPCDRCAAG